MKGRTSSQDDRTGHPDSTTDNQETPDAVLVRIGITDRKVPPSP